jgi:hypothetical protein
MCNSIRQALSHYRWQLPLLLALWMVAEGGVHAMPISDSNSVIALTIDLNCDCIKDTIVVKRVNKSHKTIPTWIYWGDRDIDSGCDSVWYSNKTTNWRARTRLVSPGWGTTTATINRMNVNGDTYPDIVVSYAGKTKRQSVRMRGEVRDTSMIDHDTSIAIVLYSQRGLDSLPIIKLGSIAAQEDDSLVAERIDTASDVTERQYTSSGYTAYRFKENNVIVDAPTQPLLISHVPDYADSRMRIYPNPSNTGIVHIDGEWKYCDYDIRVIDAAGRQVLRHIYPAGQLHSTATLDLANCSIGLYEVILIESGEHMVANWRLVLLR